MFTASCSTFRFQPRHPSYQTLLDIEQGLAKFRQHPVCLIWGMQDWCFSPWFLERFVEFFPQAEVHRLADAGHYIVEDAHERIGPLVQEFVEKHVRLSREGLTPK